MSSDPKQPGIALSAAPSRPRRETVRGVLAGIVLVFLVRAVVNETTIVDRFVAPLSRPDRIVVADAIVVLGAGITERCTPNLNGIQRVLLASDLYRQQRAPYVVFTGGSGAGPGCTVSDAMARLAERLGVPAERIRIEATSSSTWENAVRADAVLKTLGARRILLVTDRIHLGRADACFRRFGYDLGLAGVPIQLGHADNTALLAMGLREYAAWAIYWVRGRFADRSAQHALVDRVAPQPTNSMIVPSSAPTSNTVVILGASYAKAWDPSAALGQWQFVNKGAEGQQSWEMLARFDEDVVGAAPRAVVLWGFINDVFRSPREQIADSLARARQSYVAMIERALANGIEPILATEITVREKAGFTSSVTALAGRLLGRASYQDYVNRHVLDMNAWLREVARQRNLLLLDLQPVLSRPGGERMRAYAKEDGSHVSAAGYAALTAYAEPVLSSHLDARR